MHCLLPVKRDTRRKVKCQSDCDWCKWRKEERKEAQPVRRGRMRNSYSLYFGWWAITSRLGWNAGRFGARFSGMRDPKREEGKNGVVSCFQRVCMTEARMREGQK